MRANRTRPHLRRTNYFILSPTCDLSCVLSCPCRPSFAPQPFHLSSNHMYALVLCPLSRIKSIHRSVMHTLPCLVFLETSGSGLEKTVNDNLILNVVAVEEHVILEAPTHAN